MDNYNSMSELNSIMPMYRNSFNAAKNNAEHIKEMLDSQDSPQLKHSLGSTYSLYDRELNKTHNYRRVDDEVTVFYKQFSSSQSDNYTFSETDEGEHVSMTNAFWGDKKFIIDYTDSGFSGGFFIKDDKDYFVSYDSYREDDELVNLLHERLSDGQNFLDEILCNTYDKDNNLVQQHHVVSGKEQIKTEDTVYDYDKNLKMKTIQYAKTKNDDENKLFSSEVESTKVETWSLKDGKEQLESEAIDTDNKDGFDEFYRYEYSQDGKLLKEYFNDVNNPDFDYIIQHNYDEMGIEESKSIDYKVNDNWGFFENLIDSVSSWLGISSKKDVTIENKFKPEYQVNSN